MACQVSSSVTRHRTDIASGVSRILIVAGLECERRVHEVEVEFVDA